MFIPFKIWHFPEKSQNLLENSRWLITTRSSYVGKQNNYPPPQTAEEICYLKRPSFFKDKEKAVEGNLLATNELSFDKKWGPFGRLPGVDRGTRAE